MMNILWLCLLSLVYCIVIFIYLGYSKIEKDANNYIKEYVRLIKDEKLLSIFCCIAIVMMCIVSVSLEMIYKYNSLITNIKLISMIALLLPAAYIDKQQHIIPNKIIAVGFLARMIIWIIEYLIKPDSFFNTLKSDVISCVVVLVFFLICSFVVKNGLGMGDVKLIGLLGIYHGLSGIFSQLFFSLLVAFILAVYLLIRKKKTGKDVIPFAPAMLIGSVIATILTGL